MAFSQYFEHHEREAEIYRRWEESGAFGADAGSGRPAFTVSMPPPNATGTLHLGHAIMLVLEDLMIRYRRMAGDEALWVPGTDHAAIATENVVIKKLQTEEGIADPRSALGREGLLARIAAFVAESQSTIRSQVRAMGSSCDWSRERYTMDPQLNRCVAEVFGRMFRDGLIYRGARIINWDPGLQTTVSDDEIEYKEVTAKFYTLRYGPFLVGTSRPETKLGDTAVAVHPGDERWSQYVGRTIRVPWPNGPEIEIQVVADESVDPAFGTGALGVTPAHSQVDFEIAQRHGLPYLPVIGEDGRMLPAAGPYAGMTVLEAREAFVRDLEAAGLLEKVESYPQRLSLCYRSKQPIEPLIKAQWFIDVNRPAVPWKGKLLSLKQVMREVVASGDVEILPRHEEKTYFHWIDNLRDWCISRQIWWGHRVPVYYRGGQEMYVGHRAPEGPGWRQDEDTLDTWFSSALWTWSTLVDPALALDRDLSLEEVLAKSADYQKFHPTGVMETGYDILFFWVARMILMTTYATGQIPFRRVYLHGLILDRDGEKMTKSKPETAIDPLDEIHTNGTDALRLSLVIGNSAGTDFRLSRERIEASRGLVNKLWNAAKLVERTLGTEPVPPLDPAAVTHPVNRWMLVECDRLVAAVTARFDELVFGDTAEQIRTAFWSQFCDFYLEALKVPELGNLAETRAVVQRTFDVYLRLFHPFVPFVTEEIWTNLGRPGMLIRAAWPGAELADRWGEENQGVESLIRLVAELRRLRAELKIEPKAPVTVRVEPRSGAATLRAAEAVLRRMVNVEALEWVAGDAPFTGDDVAVAVDLAWRAAVLAPEKDAAAERARLEKEHAEATKRLAGLERNLANADFVAKAKPEVVAKARADAEQVRAAIAALERLLGG
ncbi:MAG TPA: valine--tRNA ligase [Thermoanaerobaculia bacterium]|nr:valine--tRNA ligase [Thermoanaerobaculia bacterium]